MYGKIKQHLQNELNTIEENGIFKRERVITSPQGAEITVNGETVLNFCANNYLGLSSHPEVVQAAKVDVKIAMRASAKVFQVRRSMRSDSRLAKKRSALAPDEYAGLTMVLLRLLAFKPATSRASAQGSAAEPQKKVPA